MKKNTIIISMIAALFLITSSCTKSLIRIKGNGSVTTETRSVSTFSRIINEGDFDVYIIQDSVSEVIIEAESNLISYIRTSVDGSTLTIDTKDNLKQNHPIKLYVHTPNVNGVVLSGSGIIDLGNISTSILEVTLSGSGDIRGSVAADDISVDINGSGSANMGIICDDLTTYISGSGDLLFNGSATTAHFNVNGSGAIKAYDLALKNCYINISGSGDMFVNVSDLLDIDISGSGSIYYIGQPSINLNITGSGSVVNSN